MPRQISSSAMITFRSFGYLSPCSHPVFQVHKSPQGVYYGIKWQCVEYARRYLIDVTGHTFESIDYAWQIFDLTSAIRLSDNHSVSWISHKLCRLITFYQVRCHLNASQMEAQARLPHQEQCSSGIKAVFTSKPDTWPLLPKLPIRTLPGVRNQHEHHTKPKKKIATRIVRPCLFSSGASCLIYLTVSDVRLVCAVCVLVVLFWCPLRSYVRFVEQNVEDSVWPVDRPYSRQLPASRDTRTGAYTIHETAVQVLAFFFSEPLNRLTCQRCDGLRV